VEPSTSPAVTGHQNPDGRPSEFTARNGATTEFAAKSRIHQLRLRRVRERRQRQDLAAPGGKAMPQAAAAAAPAAAVCAAVSISREKLTGFAREKLTTLGGQGR